MRFRESRSTLGPGSYRMPALALRDMLAPKFTKKSAL